MTEQCQHIDISVDQPNCIVPLRVGQTLTIQGIKSRKPNPDRLFWQFWKPRMIEGELQTFTVVAEG